MAKTPPEGNPESDRPAATPVVRPESLSGRHRKTLEAVFAKPVRPDIPWRSIVSLFEALGGRVTQHRGSRVGVVLGARVAVFHEPHPERVTDKGAVVSVRRFLESAGVTP